MWDSEYQFCGAKNSQVTSISNALFSGSHCPEQCFSVSTLVVSVPLFCLINGWNLLSGSQWACHLSLCGLSPGKRVECACIWWWWCHEWCHLLNEQVNSLKPMWEEKPLVIGVLPAVCLWCVLSTCCPLVQVSSELLAWSCLLWLGEAPWQGRALNNLAVAAASSSSLNLNVTCFVVFLLIFHGCTFAAFGFWKKTCWCPCYGNCGLLLKRELGRGLGMELLMGCWGLGCAQKQQESFSAQNLGWKQFWFGKERTAIVAECEANAVWCVV